MAIAWNESLSVGNELVDNDHKKLISIINQIDEALQETVNVKVIITALNDLENYTAEHFKREESLMKQNNYPHYYRHFKEHHELLSHLAVIKDDIRQKSAQEELPGNMDALIQLLRHWLLDHVIKEDILLKPFLSER